MGLLLFLFISLKETQKHKLLLLRKHYTASFFSAYNSQLEPNHWMVRWIHKPVHLQTAMLIKKKGRSMVGWFNTFNTIMFR